MYLAAILSLLVILGCGKTFTYPTSVLEKSTGNVADNSTYNFETIGSIAGFSYTAVSDNDRFTFMSWSTDRAYMGTGSVKLDCAYNAGNSGGILSRSNNTGLVLSGKTITAYIWIPNSMFPSTLSYGVQIFVQTAGNYHWYQSVWQNLYAPTGSVPGIWNKISVKVNDDLIYNNQSFSSQITDSPDNCYMWGIKVGQGGTSPNYSGAIYIDSIDIQ
jgi:hypothetical protein